MDYTDINSEGKLVQATFASTSTMSSAGIAVVCGICAEGFPAELHDSAP